MPLKSIMLGLLLAPGWAFAVEAESLTPTASQTLTPMAEAGLSPTSTPTATPSPTPLFFSLSQPPVTPDPHYAPDAWYGKWPHINLDEAKRIKKQRKVVFVDTRGKDEYDQGHIPGAISLPIGEFEKYYGLNRKKIKKAAILVTYCHGAGCHISDKVAQMLVDKGHKNVASFFGGWPQWSGAKLPVEKARGK